MLTDASFILEAFERELALFATFPHFSASVSARAHEKMSRIRSWKLKLLIPCGRTMDFPDHVSPRVTFCHARSECLASKHPCLPAFVPIR